MTRCKPGDVVVIEFPYSDQPSGMRRPGVVQAGDDVDLLVARVTTRDPRDESDVPLAGWSAVGLPRRSTVRITKLLVIDARLVQRSLGRLTNADRHALANAIRRFGESIARSLTT